MQSLFICDDLSILKYTFLLQKAKVVRSGKFSLFYTFKFATYAKHRFENGTLDDKKTIFQSLGQNFLLKDGKLSVELHKPFISIKKGMGKILEKKGQALTN
ncbi:hypothetical protein GF366_02165 [Candidatus Peregrinibacteria bacterium]|nr:hypothetical protein [Candidatus Peregrinibacteria bacterium]